MRWAGPAVAALAVAEIVVFVEVAHATSWLVAIGITLLVSAVGAATVSRATVALYRSARSARSPDSAASTDVADGVLRLAGAVLLVVPGFVTDLPGLALQARPIRRAVRRSVGRRLTDRLVGSRMASGWSRRQPSTVVIDGEVEADAPDTTMPRSPRIGRRGI